MYPTGIEDYNTHSPATTYVNIPGYSLVTAGTGVGDNGNNTDPGTQQPDVGGNLLSTDGGNNPWSGGDLGGSTYNLATAGTGVGGEGIPGYSLATAGPGVGGTSGNDYLPSTSDWINTNGVFNGGATSSYSLASAGQGVGDGSGNSGSIVAQNDVYYPNATSSLLSNGNVSWVNQNVVPTQNAWGGMSFIQLDDNGNLVSPFFGNQNISSSDPMLNDANAYLGTQNGNTYGTSTFSSDLGQLWKGQQTEDWSNGTYSALYQLYGTGGEPDPFAWKQGAAGDCYLVSSGYEVSVSNPQAIMQDIAPHMGADGNWDGSYDVNFPGLNATTNVTSDELLRSPGISVQPLNGSTQPGAGLYASVIETGWANLEGGWGIPNSNGILQGGINGGWPVNALYALTGQANTTEYLNNFQNAYGGQLSSSYQISDAGSLNLPEVKSSGYGLNQMAADFNAGSEEVVSTIANAGADAQANYGIVANHAYEVTGFEYDESGNVTGVNIQNPWGASSMGSTLTSSRLPVNIMLTPQQFQEYIYEATVSKSK